MYLTPPRLSLAANNITIAITQVTGARGRLDTSASSRSGDFTPARNVSCGCHFSLHSLELFQISEARQSFRVNGSLVRKQSEWKRWDAETLDPKKCHYQDEKIVSAGHKTSDKMQRPRKQIDGISQQKFIPSRTTDTQSKAV